MDFKFAVVRYCDCKPVFPVLYVQAGNVQFIGVVEQIKQLVFLFCLSTGPTHRTLENKINNLAFTY